MYYFPRDRHYSAYAARIHHRLRTIKKKYVYILEWYYIIHYNMEYVYLRYIVAEKHSEIRLSCILYIHYIYTTAV